MWQAELNRLRMKMRTRDIWGRLNSEQSISSVYAWLARAKGNQAPWTYAPNIPHQAAIKVLYDQEFPPEQAYVQMRWTWESNDGATKDELVQIPIETWRGGAWQISQWVTNYFGEKWAANMENPAAAAQSYYEKHLLGFHQKLVASIKEAYSRKGLEVK